MQENVLTFHKHFCPQKSFMVIWCFMDNMENEIFITSKGTREKYWNQIKSNCILILIRIILMFYCLHYLGELLSPVS